MVFLGTLASSAAERMQKAGVRGKHVTLKVWRAVANAPDQHMKGSVGHGLCDHLSRSLALPAAVATPQALADAAAKIWHALGVPATEVSGARGALPKVLAALCMLCVSFFFCRA